MTSEMTSKRTGQHLRRTPAQPRMSISHEPIFRERVKKGPENRISVVADKAAARGANPARAGGRQARSPQAACRHGALVRRWRVPRGHAPPCPLRGARPMAGPSPGPSPCSCGAGTGPYRPVARGRVSSPSPPGAGRTRPGGERCGLMPAVPGGRPARPAGQRPAGVCRRPPSGIPCPVLSAFLSGRTRPPARPRAPTHAALPAFPFPRSPKPPSAVVGRAGAGAGAGTQRDGFGGSQCRVVQAAEERGQLRADPADLGQDGLHLGRCGR